LGVVLLELNEEVRSYWEKEPCGTGVTIVGEIPERTREWFDRIEEHRYKIEPFIHSVAQFTRYYGKKILEIGVGAGTDHLQWARAGAECYGVDLTDAAIEMTKTRLALYQLRSHLQRMDAESLPFEDNTFDLVYSWGVIHHSEQPEKIIREIWRVLKPSGVFLGMVYAKYSVGVFTVWVKHALLKGKPWRSFDYINWHHMESKGTKGYNVSQIDKMLSNFSSVQLKQLITEQDKQKWPRIISRYFPDSWGRYIIVRALK